MAPQREWFEKDYYKVLGVSETRDPEGDHQGLPQARAPAPPRRQPRRREGRGAVQGDLRRLRRRSATRRSARSTTRSAGSARWRRASAAVRAAGGGPQGFSFTWATAPTSATCSAACSAAVRRGGAAGPAAASARSAAPTSRPSCTLSFDDAVHGVTTSLNLTSDAACSTCHGTGAAPGHARRRSCPRLQRPRRARRQPGLLLVQLSRARNCGGHGRRRSTTRARPVAAPASSAATREVKVRIPAGVDDGQRIRLKGRGGPGPQRRARRATSTSRPRCAAPDLRPQAATTSRSTVPVTFPEAALGARGRGADARRRPGDAARSTRRARARAAVPREGQGRRRTARRRATCSSRSRSPCRRGSTASERKAIEALAKATDESPRAHLEV